jgi:hypothetical protein
MSWDRRQFLKALACLVAAAGVDPSTVVEPLLDAPLVDIQAALAEYTISIGGCVFPLLSVVAPTIRRVIEVDFVGGDYRLLPGPRRMDPVDVVLSGMDHSALVELATAYEPADIIITLGKHTSWSFKGWLESFAPRSDDTTSLGIVPTGPVTYGEQS